MKEVKIPKNIGYGEGGETLPKLGKILQGIVDNIDDLATRVEALDDNLNYLATTRVEALEDEVHDLTERVETLEGEGEDEGEDGGGSGGDD